MLVPASVTINNLNEQPKLRIKLGRIKYTATIELNSSEKHLKNSIIFIQKLTIILNLSHQANIMLFATGNF